MGQSDHQQPQGPPSLKDGTRNLLNAGVIFIHAGAASYQAWAYRFGTKGSRWPI